MESITVQVESGSIHVTRTGAGRPLLLVHGFPLTAEMWQPQFEFLGSHFDVIAPDLIGFGESDSIPTSWSMGKYADDLQSMLLQLDVTCPVIFCGLSMGGYIGFEFWKNHRSHLEQLVFCNTRATADDEATSRARIWMATRVESQGISFVKEAMIPKMLKPLSSSESDSASSLAEDSTNPKAVLSGLFEQAKPKTIAVVQTAMAERSDFSFYLNEIDVPTTVIAGECDVITPAEEMKEMAEQIPNSTFVIIKNSGHMPPLENSSEFNQALVDALV